MRHMDLLSFLFLSAVAGSGHASLLSSLAIEAAPQAWFAGGKRDVPSLEPDTPMLDNIEPGTSSFFAFKPVQNQTTVYVTVNTCLQPRFASASQQLDPPQLILSVSTSSSYQQPTPANQSSSITHAFLDEGFASLAINSSNEIYIGLTAINATVLGGVWNFQVAASADAPYHSWINSSNVMSMVDSDTAAALFITQNLTALLPANQTQDEWIEAGVSLSVFIQNANNSGVNGVRHSYCGMALLAQIPHGNRALVDTSLSNYFGPTSLQQQFYVTGLNSSSTYYGFLARPPNLTSPAIAGGGVLYAPMNFTTKRFANCAVIYGLSFCDQVAYAVPANPATHSVSDLAALYDNATALNYQNFEYSLQQIACNTTASAQYSLAKNCTDCEIAYKQWLCAVSIPRCADWTPDPITQSQSFLFPRNAAQQPIAATPDILPVMNDTLLDRLAYNSSRNNATIAGLIQPGPYSEILPCANLCYELVRSCPAALGFSCPYAGKGLEMSYGTKVAVPGGGLSCSEPGSVYGTSGVARLHVSTWLTLTMMVMVWAFMDAWY